ncbi:hypothetical protein V9T40_008398 [Parthenolecanium corni]|uniref:DNA ligase n=1 Tax=Parthenolecanium corni TaxID=536013 RepID=A0AAN9TNH0_9HEMI
MSDTEKDEANEEATDEKLFCAERAKSGRAKCKKCKNTIDTGVLRLAKLVMNPFGTGKMKAWHHLPCLFEVFKKQRATTPKIEKIDDIGGFEQLSHDDIEEILTYLTDDAKIHWESLKKDLSDEPQLATSSKTPKKKTKKETAPVTSLLSVTDSDPSHKDNSVRQFRKICLALSNESSYLQKTNILREFFEKGSDGTSFKGDLLLWCRLLLPGAIKTVYNLQSKQLIKIFSRIFNTDNDDMLTHLEEGDVAVTVSEFFEKSTAIKPASKSTLSLQDVNEYLNQLSKLTKEDDQQRHLKKVALKCTANDLQVFVRFIKHDLRINAGPKHILDALHPDAYQAYQTCRDIDGVIKQIREKDTAKKTQSLNITVKVLTPVLPMLAQACTSLDAAVDKYPDGLYAEIKYDGERVQLHKQGSDFKYFSRSLKPVLPHKVDHFKDYIKKAFPKGDDLILDCEVLMIDMSTGNPLPFGTLGIHKKTEFKDANPCLYVFDCLYFNGESLLNSPLKKRREILQNNMTDIRHHVQFSEIKLIKNVKDLESMLTDVLDKNLEGLVLKDIQGVYEPGKRRWIKVKRDYLFEGKAADSVDLVVLGAWYGTGQKGGMMNVFLLGCFNPDDRSWRSVTKVHGHDDETLKALQTELDVIKISRDVTRVPKWLNVTKTMIPDFVARDPKKMPVWEICGHEFTKHDVHTANGISIRFPRVARVRHDKSWDTATTLSELEHLYEVSKTNQGARLLPFLNSNSDSDVSPVKKQRKITNMFPSKISTSSKDIQDEDTTKKKNSKPLPDLLAGKRIKVNNTAADKEFRRLFIAYGATVIDEDDAKKPTHKIVPGSFSMTKNDDGENVMKIQLEKLEN